MTAVLEARGLSKLHGHGDAAVAALQDVDFAVEHGEFVAVTGPSGCGKSTLLNLLGGLDRPTSGDVWLHGERLTDAGEARRARLRRSEVGFVFQFFNLIVNLTVADNVELPALLAGVPSREARRRAGELLERLGLADAAARVPGDLSGGQQQRVAIARALVNRPSVLLADEPTGDLEQADPYTLRFAADFLDAVPDRARADEVLDGLAGRIPPDGLLRVAAGTEGEVLRPLDLAVRPEHVARRLFDDAVIERELDRLADEQQDDGGWTFSWAAWNPAVAWEWRGVVTVLALRTLRAYGRLDVPAAAG